MTLPDTMSGVVLIGHGGLDRLVWRDDLPTPRPGPGEVVVRVRAAAVNNTDLNTRLGWYSKGDADAADAGWSGAPLDFPRIQGIDACGEIAATGPGVDPARLGRRVLVEPCLWEAAGRALARPMFFGSDCDGAFAQFARVAARHAHAVDSALSDEALASFPCSYSTAENMLTRARVAAGERVLVTGASGGVGSAAVQLAAARGAHVIAVAGAAKQAQVRAAGAAEVLSRETDLRAALGHDAVDVVVDLVAGPGWPALPDVLRPFGRYATAGAIGGHTVAMDVRTLYLKDQTYHGCTALDAEVFAALVRRIEAGAVRPLVAGAYPLREIAAAQTAFAEKAHTGKIVLVVD